jgi:hypothetical protein
MNRSYISKYGTFDTSFRIGMDYELLLRGIFDCRVVLVPEVVTVVRSGGLSARHRDTTVEEIVRALRKNGIIRTSLGEWAMRSYFEIRRLLSPIRRWVARRS